MGTFLVFFLILIAVVGTFMLVPALLLFTLIQYGYCWLGPNEDFGITAQEVDEELRGGRD